MKDEFKDRVFAVRGADGEATLTTLSDETLKKLFDEDGFVDEVESWFDRVKEGEVDVDEAFQNIETRGNDIIVFLRRQGKSVAETNAATDAMMEVESIKRSNLLKEVL